MKGDNKAGATANELCRGANLRHSRRRHTLRPPWGHTATYLYRRWPIFISGPAERIVFRSDPWCVVGGVEDQVRFRNDRVAISALQGD